MLVLASDNGNRGMRAAIEVLSQGGSALDAVETGIRQVELNAADHSVGLGGYPNILGEVELDAGLMDGRTRAVGAVAAVRGFAHPISIARQVMDRLPHVLLAGLGAERFAAEIGAERSQLLTPESAQSWRERLTQYVGVPPEEIGHRTDLIECVWRALDMKRRGGTVDFMAIDAQGHLAAGVSTSGFAWKYQGRVGDSPIPGAGYYADDRYGAAACIGIGERAIRAATARSIVLWLQMGYPLEQVGQMAQEELRSISEDGRSGVHIIVMTPQGRAMAFADQDPRMLAMTPDMDEPLVCAHIDTTARPD